MKTTLVENSDVFMLICLQLKKKSVMLVSFSYKEVREKIFRSKKKLKKLKSWTKFRRFHNIIIKSKKKFSGGSVAKPCKALILYNWTSWVRGLHPAASGISFSLVPSSNPESRYVNSQLVSLLPVAIFNYVTFICFLCFSSMPLN